MKDPLLYKIGRPLIAFWFKIKYKPVFINKEIIPKKGKAILAGNHISETDIFIIVSSTKRCIRGAVKNELFKGPTKYIFKGVGAIPVNRKIKDKSVIPACVEALNNDCLLGIMPEGTINRTSDIILPFKYGVIKIAIEAKSPIIPFAIISKPSHNYKKFQKNVKMVFGELYYPESSDIEKETKVLENKVIKLINEYSS